MLAKQNNKQTKTKLGSLNFRDLIDLYIGHDEFVSVNNVWKEYDGMEEAIKNLKNFNPDDKYGWYNKNIRKRVNRY